MQSSLISLVSGQREQVEAEGTRGTGDASLVQKSPDLCGGGREARDSPLQLRRLQEEEGRRDRGVWLEVSRKPRSSNSRIKATERIPWSRIPSSRCVLEPGRGRCGPFTERGGLPKVLQRERGTQERQRSRKRGVLGGKDSTEKG